VPFKINFRAGGSVYHEAQHPEGPADEADEDNRQILFYDSYYNNRLESGVSEVGAQDRIARAIADEMGEVNALHGIFVAMGEVLNAEQLAADERHEARRTVFIREVLPPENLDINNQRRYAAQQNRFEASYDFYMMM
jgi:hypothetical protein